MIILLEGWAILGDARSLRSSSQIEEILKVMKIQLPNDHI